MNDKFLKPFDPATAEARVSKLWEESGYTNPDNLPARFTEPFSIVLPPPNVTGNLHMGSALMLAIEDIMVRYARMQGKRVLWIPGTDHAAIATQSKVEKDIQKNEGKTRHDLGREEMLKRIDAFARESHDTIVNQVKKMGASIDWTREAFTLDDKRNFAVRTAFKKMYDDDLIYRGYRIVNWDPKGQTTISDDEIVYETRPVTLYTFRYSKDFPISISTTRPETKLGDTGVAVHPDDARYKQYVGKTYDAVFAGEPIKITIVADDSVDPAFGTGALGVTPAHSQIDWEIAERHKLEVKPVINEYAKMTVGSAEIKGKKTTEAREAVVAWLRKEGLLEKEDQIEQNISLAERTGGIVEPLPKLQWFIGVNKSFKQKTKDGAGKMVERDVTLKQLMHEAGSQINFVPDQFQKIYTHWIDNLRDWCISRQIWYGHRIPVWYRNEEIFCGIDAPKGEGWVQDEDTLDTWFSSGLWTFSTLGWPDEKEFAKYRMYHPTTILETGKDIIFFWVARMILMSTYCIGEVPFKTVYLHGLVRDGQGRKISKSLGNNIDPVDMSAKYGTDAVRMSLIVGVGPGNDSKISEDKIRAYRNFSNKLWNITRFILTACDGVTYELHSKKKFSAYTPADQKIHDEFTAFLAEITREMNDYKYYLVAEKLYHYAWHTLADVILEESKAIFTAAGEGIGADPSLATDATRAAALSRKQLLLDILHRLVIALHPFTPFVTEEIWSYLPGREKRDVLMVEEWEG